MWTYRCRVVRVVDGDTVDVIVDLGFGVHKAERVRLAGIDTPERGEPMWGEATRHTQVWVETHRDLVLTSQKPSPRDQYGRYLAVIVDLTGVSLNDSLLAAGLAQPWPKRDNL